MAAGANASGGSLRCWGRAHSLFRCPITPSGPDPSSDHVVQPRTLIATLPSGELPRVGIWWENVGKKRVHPNPPCTWFQPTRGYSDVKGNLDHDIEYSRSVRRVAFRSPDPRDAQKLGYRSAPSRAGFLSSGRSKRPIIHTESGLSRGNGGRDGMGATVDRHKVTTARERIDSGFYDDPEILDALMDRCIEAIVCEMNRSAARATRAQVIAALPTGRAHRARVRPAGRKRYAVAAGR